jgi:hypothetical protein
MGIPRKVIQIAVTTLGEGGLADTALFALADDGSIWGYQGDREWVTLPPLPEAEACGAQHLDAPPCTLVNGHSGHHWNGGRKWQ